MERGKLRSQGAPEAWNLLVLNSCWLLRRGSENLSFTVSLRWVLRKFHSGFKGFRKICSFSFCCIVRHSLWGR